MNNNEDWVLNVNLIHYI